MDHSKHNMRGHYPPSHSGFSKQKAAFEATLKSKKQIAEGTMAFIFEKPKEFPFRAGQHVRLTLLNAPKTDSEGNSRFFSIASSPLDIMK